MATIEQVLDAHTSILMDIPGVVGVGQSEAEDGRDCILVMVAHETPELSAQIPSSLDGFPIVIEVTGDLAALSDA